MCSMDLRCEPVQGEWEQLKIPVKTSRNFGVAVLGMALRAGTLPVFWDVTVLQ